MALIQLSTKQFGDLWKRFLAYQAQFHARDFVTLNPRDNQARFIKIIRALISSEDFACLGIDINLLSQADSREGVPDSSILLQMQKLCRYFDENNAFTLNAANADDNTSIMSFKKFTEAPWKALIEKAKVINTSKQDALEAQHPSKKNTRQRIDPLSALAVDVQQQNEIQASFQLQSLQSAEYQSEQQSETTTSKSEATAISFTEFWSRLTTSESLDTLSITQADLHRQWCHWSSGRKTCPFSNKETPPHRELQDGDIQFTYDAAMELFRWRHLFQAGIDIYHLPAGFHIKKQKNDRGYDVYLLDYLPQLKEVTELDRLAIQCNKPLSFAAEKKSCLTLDDVKDVFKEYQYTNEGSIKHLYDYALKYFPDKDTLQKNPDYMQSAQVILNLSASQRRWWEQLFEQHTSHCGQDDFPSLVMSFQAFLEELTLHHQHFDFYPPKFNNVKSMPVALSLMLALLDQSKNEDKQTQWNCMTELHLTGYEVGMAIRTSQKKNRSARYFPTDLKPCSFIVPAMRVEEVDVFSGHYDLLFAHALDWDKDNYGNERLFYLTLSHKPFRLPLSFYQGKFKAISQKNFDDATKASFYYLLVESCTGTTPAFTLKSPEQIDAQWELLLRNINILAKKMKISDGVSIVTRMLGNLQDVPDIFYLNRMIETIATQTSENLFLDFKKTVHYLDRFYNFDTKVKSVLLNKKETTSISDLWEIKCCFEDYLQPNYVNLAEVFDFLPVVQKNDRGSSFKEGFAKVLDKWMEDERTYCLSECILDKLSCLALPTGKPYLTAQQFIEFVNAVYEEAKNHQTDALSVLSPESRGFRGKRTSSFETFYNNADFIDPILRSHFPEYVNEDLLTLSVLDPDELLRLEQTIKARVKDKNAQQIIKSIIIELSCDRTRKGGHEDLVDKLIIITNAYPGEDRSEFLLSLKNQLALGALFSRESNRGFENRLEQLNELLQTVIDTGTIEQLRFLIAEFEGSPPSNNKNALKKCSYALKRLLSLMNKEFASTPARIELTEQLLLCKEFISAHRADYLMGMQQSGKELHSDETLFIEMLQAINKISAEYPVHARALNAFFIHSYETMNQTAGGGSLQRAIHLCQQLSSLQDSDLILSIIHLFTDKDDASLFSIQSLEYLFHHSAGERQNEIFKIFLAQTNQSKQNISKEEVDAFLRLVNKEHGNKQFTDALSLCFAQLPFPTFCVFTDWWTSSATNPKDKLEFIKDKYQAFLQQPFPRDDKSNGFKVEKALQQTRSKEMSNIALRYTAEFIEAFHQKCVDARQRSFAELMSTLHSAKDDADCAPLIIIMAELLYRSTGQEINTTQYLAIDSLLSSGKHVTSEIDTGEGKTRIAMLLLAVQAYTGQTCDFVTSDMQLAESAYLSYCNFFKMLGISCHLIRSESNVSEYQTGAIHFSDCGNLSLFRNKATAALQLHETIDANPERRTLLLDESDKTWFDLYDISYNFSMPADKTLTDMDWVYTQLINFFSEDGYRLNPERMEYYYEDIEQCTKKFREFVTIYGTRLQVARLNSINDEQISRWHESAVAALSLRYQVDFSIEPNARIKTDRGPKIASEALVMADNQVNRHSKFSNGVQQCLHARLNILRHKELDERSTPLDIYLHNRCTQAFHIAPENQVIASSSSETFLNFYREGHTYGMTGTAGADKEKREVEEYFGIANQPDKKYFIKMPRQRENCRVDKPICIVQKDSDKIAKLVEYVIDAQSKSQPILVFCENDREATFITEQLNQQLQTALSALSQKISIRQVRSTMPLKEQTAYLANDAGKPGAVTISTGMLGRGKDILLQSTSPTEDATQYGLKTIDLTYPNYRELRQRLGRAARNGQPGETHILLSEEELKTRYRLKYSERSSQHIESLLLKRQHFETDKNQLERRIKMSLHEYVGQYQKAYFNRLLPLLKKNGVQITDKQSAVWVTFFNALVLVKQKALNDLMGIIHNPSFSVQKLRVITDELHTSIQKKWDGVLAQLTGDLSLQTQIKSQVNPFIHRIELRDWEKRRILEIKNEQLRLLRARIVTDGIKANESFWVYLNRKLYEFAQWVSWSSLVNYLDKRYQFGRPISDEEIATLIYNSEESYSKMSELLDENSTCNTQEPVLIEPQHTDLFKTADSMPINSERDLVPRLTDSVPR